MVLRWPFLPTGTYLAYAATQGGTQQLYLRAMSSLEAQPVLGTEGAVAPFFSPDGQWLGFFSGGKLKKISVGGGAAVTLADAASSRGGSWSSQGIIAFNSTNTNLQQISDAGGASQLLTPLEKGDTGHRWPDFLPGGKGVLFNGGNAANPRIKAYSTGTSEQRGL